MPTNDQKKYLLDTKKRLLRDRADHRSRIPRNIAILQTFTLYKLLAFRKAAFARFSPKKEWCRVRDSNSRPTVYKTVALPLC